jgi:signal transduction histidine kinase
VSHELRSPLARLQMAVGLARQQPDQIEAWFERIDREAERMDKLVDELLTLSRLEAGVEQTPATTVDISEVLDDVLSDAQFEAEAQARKLRWRIAVDALEGVSIAGHAELLHRAIENVVRNAVKHAPDGGEVSVEAEVRERGREVRLTIQDNGPGVPQSELAAIFEPFFRSAGAKGTDGHGVGLAIAQSIVALHAGTIAAANRREGGLRVEIVLPARGRP